MTTTNVHLEDVARAARQGFGLSVAASLLVLAGMLMAGLAPVVALLTAAALLAAGCASGGFGLVARVTMRPPRLPRRADGNAGTAVPPLRIPQPR